MSSEFSSKTIVKVIQRRNVSGQYKVLSTASRA